MMSFRLSAALLLSLGLASPAPAQDLENVALLLPLKGRMAKAAHVVRDGFIAAYYQDLERRQPSPIVRIYDNSDGQGVTLVNMAAFDGAEAVVGPLNKEQVAELAAAGSPPIPVLALNRANDRSITQLYQYALAPEEEIADLINLLQRQGVRQVRVLTQADPASERYRQLFESNWKASGGSLIPAYTLNPTGKGGVTAGIKQLLADPESKKLDALFLASPGLSKQVRPALNYYYGKLPLYTLSPAFDASESAVQRQDLNGLRFCDQPWVVSGGFPEQEALYASFGRPTSNYDRLYAFGADAYSLIKDIYRNRNEVELAGRSGHLHLDGGSRIQRELSCVEIREGNAEVIDLAGGLAPAAPRP